MAATPKGQTGEAAAAVATAVEATATEAANLGTVGLYYVREHVQQSLPTVLHTRRQFEQTGRKAQDATYAANHSREFAATLRTSLPASLHRMEASLRDATWAAEEATRRYKAQQGGTSILGSLVPQRLLEVWPASRGTGGSGSSGGSGGMYG